nr:MAG TPA: hypothetical protein [Caudoviricetes sp.]
MLKLADLGRNAWVGFLIPNQPPAVTVWGLSCTRNGRKSP